MASRSEAAKRRWQDPEYRERMIAARRSPLTLEQRIRARILPPDERGCRRWRGPHERNGYARFSATRDGQTININMARFIYEAEISPIPPGYTIDHVKDRGCYWKDCLEPSHLEAVTYRENILRSDGPAALNARKTHCPQGHPYDEENTEIRLTGARRCRACNRVAARKAAARNWKERRAYSRQYRAEHLEEIRRKDAERQRQKRTAARAAKTAG